MNIAVAQSGGPTCAINASLVGVFSEALKEPSIDAIFGSINGIEGMIENHDSYQRGHGNAASNTVYRIGFLPL